MSAFNTTPVISRTAVLYEETNCSHALSASAKRKRERAIKYCENLGLDHVQYPAANSSGYHRPRPNADRLADLIDAARRGLIMPGSALIIDGLARPSRQKPRKTLGQLTELVCDHMIEIHTLPDQQIHNKENFDISKLSASFNALCMAS